MSSSLVIYAAGSLQQALRQIAQQFYQLHQIEIDFTFGPAGILADKIAHGDKVDIFVSANTLYPQQLLENNLAQVTHLLCANQLCLVMRDDPNLTSVDWLSALADPRWTISTSTPKQDPGGDYAVEFLEQIERKHPGVGLNILKRTKPLLGGSLPKKGAMAKSSATNFSVTNSNVTYPAAAELILARRADIHIGYANHFKKIPYIEGVSICHLPAEYQVEARYSLAQMDKQHPQANLLIDYLLSKAGQDILVANGFISLS